MGVHSSSFFKGDLAPQSKNEETCSPTMSMGGKNKKTSEKNERPARSSRPPRGRPKETAHPSRGKKAVRGGKAAKELCSPRMPSYGFGDPEEKGFVFFFGGTEIKKLRINLNV